MPIDMTPERWRYIERYAADVFGKQDDHLAGLMADAVAHGLPDIAVSPEVGRLFMMLAQMTGATLIVELGTLAGYSGIWLARGLAPGGRLITVEKSPEHASFAQRQFERAGVGDRVDLRIGAALDVLPGLVAELGPEGADIVFFDAVKTEYLEYWRLARPLIRPGGLILADNAYHSDWTIDQEDHPTRIAVDRFNRAVADDPDFEAIAVPLRSGVLIGRRSR